MDVLYMCANVMYSEHGRAVYGVLPVTRWFNRSDRRGSQMEPLPARLAATIFPSPLAAFFRLSLLPRSVSLARLHTLPRGTYHCAPRYFTPRRTARVATGVNPSLLCHYAYRHEWPQRFFLFNPKKKF